MVAMTIQYQGDLHCEATHGPSGTRISTDAPLDNHGRGESFSPTDLVGAALGSCILTVMGIIAARLEVDLTGAEAKIEKEMSSDPRRIGRLSVHLHMPHALPTDTQTKLERTAHTCPVHKSLHPDIQMPMIFHWGAS